MNRPENIRDMIQRMRFRGSEQTHDHVLADVLDAHAQSRSLEPSLVSVLTRRRLMWKRLTQIGLAAVMAIIALAIFIPSGNGIAFADVLEYIQQPSYTFSLTVQTGKASNAVRGMVLRPGRARFEATMGAGTISTVMNLDERRSLLLFHQFIQVCSFCCSHC